MIEKQGLKDGWKVNANGVLYHQGLLYVPEIVWTKLISRYHNEPLAGHFRIDKTQALITRKYYWLIFRHDVEAYIAGYGNCLVSKTVRHKPYSDLQSFLISTYWWKDLSIDFITGLPVSINWKRETYDSILVIVDQLTRMIYYKPVSQDDYQCLGFHKTHHQGSNEVPWPPRLNCQQLRLAFHLKISVIIMLFH